MAPHHKASSPILLLLISIWLVLSCLSSMPMTTAATITTKNQDGTGYCIKAERDALLTFKAGIIDEMNRLSSWDQRINLDCCQWSGVRCDNNTGHVTHLDLRNWQRRSLFECDEWDMRGNMSPSLLGLKHLRYLDLSHNCFDVGPIPKFLGSLEHLLHLDLSYSNFSGLIPHELGNLTKLRYLDLSYMINHITVFDDADWLSRLSSLRYLIMDRVNLSTVNNIMQSLNKLSYIKKVSLSDCRMKNLPQSFPHDLNFTSLAIMDIQENNFHNAHISIPEWLFRISSLRELHMSNCGLTGTIPSSVGNATSLEYLDLSSNKQMFGAMPREFGDLCNLHSLSLDATFSAQILEEFRDAFSGCIKRSLNHFSFSYSNMVGSLPDWLGNLKNLTFLDLFGNALHGSIPSFVGRLSRLQYLDLRLNNLNSSITESLGQLTELRGLYLSGNNCNYSSVITESHLANLTSLQDLMLDDSNLVLNLSADWLPGFLAEEIHLDHCYVGPKFPVWLSNQVNLSSLSISSAGIEDFLPDWFWNITHTLTLLDLRKNAIRGKLPYRLRFNAQQDDVVVLLSSNLLEGFVPYFSPNIGTLDLHNNSFSGVIPSDIGDFRETNSQLRFLSLSSNNLSGNIPKSINNFFELGILDLSDNNFSGVIPNCWNKQPNLYYLSLSINMLEGGVSDTIGSLKYLQVLDLSKNDLHGELTSSLKNCTSLITLALDHNMLTGNFLTWVGGVLTSLSILTLKGNKFSGNLPLLFNLTALHFLDLSHNFFSGTIPQSYGNFTAMINATNYISSTDGGALFYSDWGELVISIYLYMKGREIQFGKSLSSLIFIDLSGNNLSGQIPKEMVNLDALQSLSLSDNHLYGEIPAEIGLMQSLESLDLSNNKLTGLIPSSLSTLHFLESLNLTNNNLSGKIPFAGQSTTFDPSAYAGNQNLCGAPLLKNCKDETQNGKYDHLEDENNNDSIVWFFIGLMPGFVVGFWSICGILIFKKEWRYTYFKFVDYMYDKVYIMVAVIASK